MIKQLVKGAATYVPGAYDLFSRKKTGGTDSARYCYSVWLRHVVMAAAEGLPTNPTIVAELGPGDSTGTGLAALLSGAERYFAFDVFEYADTQTNLQTFDELIDLFRSRADIPGEDEFPAVEPYLDSYVFPAHILTDDRLEAALEEGRLGRIRDSITNTSSRDSMIQYKVPWYDSDIVDQASVDMVFSQAVLEHVDDLPLTYERIHRWLKPTGFMSHSIDFKSHGSANAWNGHWTYSDLTWKIIKGKRPFTINRRPYSHHLALMSDAGFTIVRAEAVVLPTKIDSPDLAPQFRSMPPSDLTTASVFVLATV